MGISTTKTTAEQYLELGEDTDGLRRELLDGEIVVSPSANFEHARIVTRLSVRLLQHVLANKLGEVVCDLDTIIGEHDVPRPDVLFFGNEKVKLVDRKRSNTVPDLAIEVLSPSNANTDRKYKFELYARGEISCYWIANPKAESLQAYQLIDGVYQLVAEGHGNQTFSAPPLRELNIDLAELWWRKAE